MDHILKVHSAVWPDLVTGIKTWEFRLNDRDYKKGDILTLRKWDDGNKRFVTGPRNTIERTVTYILKGPAFGIPAGYCIMSII